ncbi:MAG: alanine--tRNA ligase [Magnetococcales bacterium]|nr:alanine--tRNA ligase [Magnetococcales bacterium]
MTGNDIRKRFIDFFKANGHEPVPSSGLIPRNDPTLLFTNAGMVQFKSVFLGEEKRPYATAVTSQKCVRAGGKHNDLENVGRTARHHTFFEMLGNFSFGDYFKEGAIELGWRFVTQELGLPPERLLVTVYAADDDAYDIWRDRIGLPEEKVIRIPTSDNFWSMGPTGPCGPCSEIFYDHGPGIPGGPPGSDEEDGDRFIEIWNLVFMQYDRDESGNMTPLPRPCIDTGAGLERITAILQGKPNNYDSDLFQPLIQAAARQAGVAYGDSAHGDVSLRVIADHLRAVSFLIADGVTPSNEGRGYVLRRIMRRAMRHGKLLGMEKPFLHELVGVLAAEMAEAYPELTSQRSAIAKVIEVEERRFAATLGSGIKILEEKLQELWNEEGSNEMGMLDGDTVFSLYDTYGFPVDLTADICRDRGVLLDMDGFDRRMAEQKKRARAAWAGSGDAKVNARFHEIKERIGAVEFVGYVGESAQGNVVALLKNGQPVERLVAGEEGSVVVNQTPFYGESGGQVGDQGGMESPGVFFRVVDAQKPLPDLIIHFGKVETGELKLGDSLLLRVDGERRGAIRLHHSATHLLHLALRRVLGDHVKQAGSKVEAERLRFDFSHHQAMSAEEMAAVEELVNAEILANAPQETTVMPPAEAVALGAMALFGEKYGDEVRVVRLGPSVELCGGTHVSRSGDIGVFRIVSEGAVAAGMRRIEGVCGTPARRVWQREVEELKRTAGLLKAPPDGVAQGVERLFARVRELERELEKAKGAVAGQLVESLAGRAVEVKGIRLLAASVEGVKDLRELVDRLKDKLGEGVIVLGAAAEGKVALVVGVTKGLTGRIKAGELLQHVAAQVGGKGGGRPDLAQGGGTDPAKLPEALASAAAWLETKA